MNLRTRLWKIGVCVYPFFLKKVYKMNIGTNCTISWKAHLDKSINPKGIHIGDNTWILSGATILAHDHCRNLRVDTYIGSNCVIGIESIILPGLRIGNHVVIGAGSIVVKDVPSNCIVVGNPAKVVKEGIEINNKGQII